MSKHTPGPWVYGDWTRKAEGVYDGAGWVEVWSKFDPNNCLPIIACKHHDELANARLIAAAPELLEFVLAFLEEYSNGMYSDYHIVCMAEYVRNKATGEQQ